MGILRGLEIVALVMLIGAVVCLLGFKAVEHVAGMVAPHTLALDVIWLRVGIEAGTAGGRGRCWMIHR